MSGSDLSVADAAVILGISKNALYKRLREIAWLHVGNAKNGLHNTPRTFALKNQWVRTETRGYKAPYDHTVARIYEAVLITQKGLQELKNMAAEAQAPKPPIAIPAAQSKATAEIIPFDPIAAQRERDQVMQQLKEWGIAN